MMGRDSQTNHGQGETQMNRRNRHARAAAGFTLIEVLIAIAIVVVLLGIVAVNILGAKERAEPDVAKIQMSKIESALEQFYLVFDRFPTEEEGLEALWSDQTLDVDDEALADRWYSFLKDPAPEDVWGNEWGYRAESEHGEQYDLWSNGPDGEEGTDDDITAWTDEEDDGFGGDFGSDLPAPPAP